MNGILKSGEILKSKNGKNYKVLNLSGANGQGETYNVSCEGNEFLFYWYYSGSNHANRNSNYFEKMIVAGSPGSDFQWPFDIIYTHDSFGCVCNKSPLGYYSIIDFLKRKVVPSFETLCNLCENISINMKKIHENNYVLLAEYDFLFNPINGNVFITVWNKLKRLNDTKTGYIGTPRLSAPEVVKGESNTTKESDLFVLAIYLFYLLCASHPLEGKLESEAKVLDYELNEKLYGTSPVFIFDPNDDSNRPIKGYHDNAIIFWQLYPKYLKEMFIKCFTDGILIKSRRPSEDEWTNVFRLMKKQIKNCPHCGAEVFVDNERGNYCWSCHNLVEYSSSNTENDGDLLREILMNHKDIWKEPKKFKAMLMDYYPIDKIQRNLILACVEEHIPDEIEKLNGYTLIDKQRYINRLIGAYDCNYLRASEIIQLWLDSLGIKSIDEIS